MKKGNWAQKKSTLPIYTASMPSLIIMKFWSKPRDGKHNIGKAQKCKSVNEQSQCSPTTKC
jgi:hypothetical protein